MPVSDWWEPAWTPRSAVDEGIRDWVKKQVETHVEGAAGGPDAVVDLISREQLDVSPISSLSRPSSPVSDTAAQNQQGDGSQTLPTAVNKWGPPIAGGLVAVLAAVSAASKASPVSPV